MNWILGILGVLTTSGIIGGFSFAFQQGSRTAVVETEVVQIKKDVSKVENSQKELENKVSEIVSKGVETGVTQSLQRILDAIEENRGGNYQRATTTNER